MFTSDEDMEKVRDIVKRMVKRAIALGGTCTGEHGVGIGKREYLYEELGEGTVELMKKIKRTIDPHNLFNPGKVRLLFIFPRNCSAYGLCSCTRTRHLNLFGAIPIAAGDVFCRTWPNLVMYYTTERVSNNDLGIGTLANILPLRASYLTHLRIEFPLPRD